jgi:hypothetical protein
MRGSLTHCGLLQGGYLEDLGYLGIRGEGAGFLSHSFSVRAIRRVEKYVFSAEFSLCYILRHEPLARHDDYEWSDMNVTSDVPISSFVEEKQSTERCFTSDVAFTSQFNRFIVWIVDGRVI